MLRQRNTYLSWDRTGDEGRRRPERFRGASSRHRRRPGVERLEDRRLPSAITEFPLPTAGLNPSHLTVGPDGNLWFTESSQDATSPGAIGRITPTGAITQFQLPTGDGSPSSLMVGPDGDLWFTDGAGIGRITPAGDITQFPGGGRDLTVGPDGNLWFIDGGAIGRITPAGVATYFPLPESQGSLSGLTVGPDGNLWSRDYFLYDFGASPPGNVDRITPAGAITQFPLPDGFPGDLTVGPDGNLWFTVEGGTGFYGSRGYGIGRITPSGAITEFALPGNHDPAYYASSDLTAGPDGNLWFNEALLTITGLQRGAAIGRITPSGAITRFPLRTRRDFNQGVLTTGSDGNLWLTWEVGNDKRTIIRITPAGAVTVFPFPPGHLPPNDLIVGPDGNLWFADGAAIGRLEPNQPRVTKVIAVAHPGRAFASVLIDFDGALDPASASKGRFYGLAAGVASGQTTVFSKRVKIARVSYDRAAHAVWLKLAVPQRRPVQVTVYAGLAAADGMSSSSEFTAVVM
jgi:streptogramin lyase